MSEYIKSPFDALLPLSYHRPTIVIRSESGQTNHLNISPETLEKIRVIIDEQYDTEEVNHAQNKNI